MELGLRVEERTIFSKIDWSLVLVIIVLNTIGLINLYSATHGISGEEMGGLFYQQIVWLLVGWGMYFIITLIDYQFLSRLAYAIYILNLLALLGVTFFGKVAYGAQRWIELFFFRYQPSETMKLAVIILFSHTLSEKSATGPGMSFKDLL